MWEDELHWPKMIEIPCIKDDDPEVRKESQVYVTSVCRDVTEEFIMYYSFW